MTLNLLDKIGNWNPQLFREIKGRLKIGNIAIASAISLSGQLLLFMCFRAQIPIASGNGKYNEPNSDKFCVLETTMDTKSGAKCVRDALGNFVINWPHWWLQIFIWVSIFSVLALLVAGTYLLVSDLDKEERRGTLNFIRLSPQSAKTIFLGKIFGVPILLYLAAILAVPLHLYSGLAARIPLSGILCFYIAVIASCALFYSTAMLFGLTTSWLGGFQPWLASGTAFMLFGIFFMMEVRETSTDLLIFLSPIAMLRYLLFGVIKKYDDFYRLGEDVDKLQWFSSRVGTNIASGLALSVLICGIGTYWMWQGWQRRFPNPSATILSKRQSYLLVVCCQPIMLGFALQSNMSSPPHNLGFLLIFNLVMFLVVIASLTSDRQSLYDWARYRQQIVPSSHKLWRRYPLLDLIWSEKSPPIVAIAINVLSSVIILIPLVLFHKIGIDDFWAVICSLNLILIYAAITQLFLFTKTLNQEIWAAGSVGSAILLPPLVLSMLLLTPQKAPILWLSSTFVSFGFSGSFVASADTILFSLLSQWSVLVLLNLKLKSQLKLAGESASRALLKA
ncbi:MAG: hypothetical protein EAZ09_08075 [Oscillatoriales cyanobacterium]|nr:MAG: hypothetical protein EAZ18_01705 [Oscillatoriales cyanobacterium]TAH23305.1 MAG: hypothetical protein EAZ09_08075 [Oscillatoriales cyanobacterium]